MFFQFLREITGGIFNSFFVTCTVFGDTTTALIMISLLYWCIDKKLGEYIFISLGVADVVNGLAKVIACVYRPWIIDPRVKPLEEVIEGATGYSFPSGHVTTATSIFGGAFLRGNFSKLLKVVLIICLALVGLSRIYVGVHSILDIIGGFIFTLIVLLIMSKLFDKLEENPKLDIIISVVGIIFALVVILFAVTKSYPMDYDAVGKLIVNPAKLMLDTISNAGLAIGFFIAWPIERRFIKFSTEGNTETKLTRAICGFIGLQLILTVINPLFAENPFQRFFPNFILTIFIMMIYPAIIKFFQKRNSKNAEPIGE